MGGGYSFPHTANTLTARMGKGINTTCDEGQTLIPTTGADFDVAHSLRGEGFDASEDGTGRGTPLVPIAFNGRMDPIHGSVPGALDSDPSSQCVAFSCKDSGADAGSVSPSLRAMNHNQSHANAGGQVAVAYEPFTLAIRGRGDSHQLEYRQDGTANAILTPNGGRGGIGVGAVATTMQVRRLTPRECERLQGFPDQYTCVPYRNKPADKCPDGPRYKALGNSMAVPVMRWIGKRIKAVEESREAA